MRKIVFIAFMFLIVISYSYGEEIDSTTTPDIHFEIPNFYQVNTSGVVAKNIGVMGWGYLAIFRVTNIDKIKNPENASIKFRVVYDELLPINGTFFVYNGDYKNEREFNDSVPLSECEQGCYSFNIAFTRRGTYLIEYELSSPDLSLTRYNTFLSIVTPSEIENLERQKALTESQINASKASKETATETRRLVRVTGLLALITLALGIATVWLGSQTKKSSEEIAEANKIAVQPSVSCDIISGVTPIKKLKIPIDGAVKKEHCYKVNTLIINHTKFPADVTINLNLKVKDEVIDTMGDLYTGVEHWNIAPNRRFPGGFSLKGVLKETGYDIDALEKEQEKMIDDKEDWKKHITMEVVVELHLETGGTKSYPQSKYAFNFKECQWYDTNYNYYV